jgi:2-oxoglutarate ferredoxin oxidoreductase subunit gamma
MRYEIRFAGSGGQGIVAAGLILARAGMSEGHHVVHSQNYGPETRGGNSVSEVMFSDAEIDYPRAVALDMLVALSQTACDENLRDMKPDGLVIVDSDLVKKVLWGRVVRTLLQRKAVAGFGDQRFANVVALGVLVSFCPWVSVAHLRRAVREGFSAELLEPNLLAFEEGLRSGRRLRKSIAFEEMEGAIEV